MQDPDFLYTTNSKARRGLIITFDLVATVSSLTMFFILLAAWLNPYIHRTRPWYSMCITFSVFPLLYLINAVDQFQLEKNPPFGMCQFQASLIYAGAFRSLTDLGR